MTSEENNYPKYLVLSPISRLKFKFLREFIASAKTLVPPPDDIVICVDYDSGFFEEFDPVELGVTVKISPEMFVSETYLERIASAREILRNHFIYHPEHYEVALWLDSDIMAAPELFTTLYDELEKENALIVVNSYLGRNPEGRNICGSGCMLTHRIACTASRFYLGKIETPDGMKNLSEDFMFFSGIDQGRHFLKMWTERSGRICREFIKLKHYLD